MEKLFSDNNQTKKRLLGIGVMGAVSLAALTGCSSGPGIENDKPGTVVEHIYYAPYTSFLPVGKILMPEHHAAEYELEVRQCGRAGDSGADANGCVTAGVDVTAATYEQFHDGDTIVFRGN